MKHYGHDFIVRSKKYITKLWMFVALSLFSAVLFTGLYLVFDNYNEKITFDLRTISHKVNENTSVTYSNQKNIQKISDELQRMRINQIRDRKIILDSLNILKMELNNSKK